MQRRSSLRRAAAGAALGLAVAILATPAGAEKVYRETVQTQRGWFTPRPARGTPAEQWELARSLEAAGRRRAAARHDLALVRSWPQAPEAPGAQLAYARWFEDRGKLQRAFDEYQRLFDQYAGAFPYEEILNRQFAIATNLMHQKKGRFLFLPGFHAPERAVPLLEKLVLNGAGWERTPEAQFLIGRAHELNHGYEEAIAAYMSAEHRYPGSPWAADAAFGMANCYYRLAKESPNNDQALDNGWAALSAFLQRYPADPRREDAERRRDELVARRALLAYERGLFYDRIARRPEAARISYESFIRNFPNAEQAPLARERLRVLAQRGESAHE